MSTYLLAVDVQNDFCPGGKLAVLGGDRVVAPINRLAEVVRRVGGKVVFSRDWHPLVTSHFIGQGGMWPEHGVAGTDGAQLRADLTKEVDDIVVDKGTLADDPGYSAASAWERALQPPDNSRILVAGLATDHCVRATALELLEKGYRVVVVTDAIAAVDPQATPMVLLELVARGADVREVDDLIAYLEEQSVSVGEGEATIGIDYL